MTTFTRWTIVTPNGKTVPYREFPVTFQRKWEARAYRQRRGYSPACRYVRVVVSVERKADV